MNIKASLLKVTAAAVLLASSQSALAAYAFALAEYTGISAIRTTGTATAVVISEAPFFASGVTGPLGFDDIANDGVSFDSETNPFGEATAVNPGPAASSLAEAAMAPYGAIATTGTDIEIGLDGEGTVEVDFGFSLLVDSFDNGPDGYAVAFVEAFGGLEGVVASMLDITGPEVGGIGKLETITGVLTLSFFADGFGPASEFVGISTLAEVSAVPVPAAVWLMGSALVGLVGFRRS